MDDAIKKVVSAAEALNRYNVECAQVRAQNCSSADILYRDHMPGLHRKLDEAFQEYYAAQIPLTEG